MLCKIKGILNKPLKVLSSKLELLVNLNVFQRVTHELLQEHVTQCIRVSRERFHRARVLVFHAHLSEWKFFWPRKYSQTFTMMYSKMKCMQKQFFSLYYFEVYLLQLLLRLKASVFLSSKSWSRTTKINDHLFLARSSLGWIKQNSRQDWEWFSLAVWFNCFLS